MKIFTRCNISNSVSWVALKGRRPYFILFKASSFVRSMPFLYSRLFLQSRLLFINFVVSKKQLRVQKENPVSPVTIMHGNLSSTFLLLLQSCAS